MNGAFHQLTLWLGSAVIFVLAIPMAVLLAMIYGVSALVDMAAG